MEFFIEFDVVMYDAEESRRRCARVSRMLRKLWAHGLIYRVKNESKAETKPAG